MLAEITRKSNTQIKYGTDPSQNLYPALGLKALTKSTLDQETSRYVKYAKYLKYAKYVFVCIYVCNSINMPKYAIKNMHEICQYICRNMQKYASGNMHKYAEICNGKYSSNMQVYAKICSTKYAIICKDMHIHYHANIFNIYAVIYLQLLKLLCRLLWQ